MNNDSLHRVRALSALVVATVVAACGGGSDAPPPPVAGPPPATVAISGKAVDGPLKDAIACYDLNDNSACESSEPTSAASDVDGNFALTVLATDSGKHRVIVNVPATAIDKDTGAAVGAAFTMQAPATGISTAHSVFVSPLTTLVQQQMDGVGQTLSEARDFVQTQAGLNVSPLADFTAAANADNARAADAAKLVLKTAQQQATALAAVVGQNDVSGAAITAADLNKAVVAEVIEALPSIGAAAADSALAGLSGAAREQALAASAGEMLAQLGFTPEQAKFKIGLPRLPVLPQSATPEPGARLVALQYTDAAHWFMRANVATAADNTADANGLLRYVDVRTRMAPYAWQPDQGVAESFTRTSNPELHWNGSTWTRCKLGDRNFTTARDALGRSSYSFCDNNEKGNSQRAEIDISGQSLASVWTDKLLPEAAKTTSAANWSLPNTGLLGTASFPAGSRLIYTSTTPTETAITYNTPDSNRDGVFADAVAQGGDARAGALPCSNPPPATLTTSLEMMAAGNPGKPCIFNPSSNADGTSGTTNESWGTTTKTMGTIPNGNTLPAGTGNYYTTTARLRVAFTGANNVTTYYRCLERRIDSSTRNCTPIGNGTYTITTLGDARVMTFNNLPVALQGLGSTRVFVERGGHVYFGFKNRVGATFTSMGFNLPAANALLYPLRLPGIQPADAPAPLTGAKATNAATMKGVWYFSDAFGTGLLRVGDNGEYVLAGTDAPGATSRPGYERGWLDIDAAGKMNRLLALDTDGDSGLSHFNPAATVSVTETAFTITTNGVTEGFDGRLPDSGAGIVGMWALGSATDLKAVQFVFFANGKVLSIHPAETEGACATSRLGPPGIEWSDYTFNASTGALRIFNKIYDSTGCTGVFDSAAAVPNTEANFVVTMAADQKTFTVPVDGGATILTAYRIAPKP